VPQIQAPAASLQKPAMVPASRVVPRPLAAFFKFVVAKIAPSLYCGTELILPDMRPPMACMIAALALALPAASVGFQWAPLVPMGRQLTPCARVRPSLVTLRAVEEQVRLHAHK
jgi:hypothetical protein